MVDQKQRNDGERRQSGNGNFVQMEREFPFDQLEREKGSAFICISNG